MKNKKIFELPPPSDDAMIFRFPRKLPAGFCNDAIQELHHSWYPGFSNDNGDSIIFQHQTFRDDGDDMNFFLVLLVAISTRDF